MKGRIENQIKAEDKIIEKLKTQPSILNEYYLSFGDRKSHTTKGAYLGYVMNFLDFLKYDLDVDVNNYEVFRTIKHPVINQYMESIKYRVKDHIKVENGTSIRATKFYAITNFFEFLESNDYIDVNPCNKVEAPKINKENEITSLDIYEIQTIERNIANGVGSHKAQVRQALWKNRDLAIIFLGLTAGLRVTSISEINMEDINFENNIISVTEKGNKTRNCKIGQQTMDRINLWIKDRKYLLDVKETECNALFISSVRERITSRSIARIIEKYTYNIKKNITPHKLRSSCATNLYEATGDLYLVQEVLGQSEITNTKRYTQVSEKKREYAANILDNLFHSNSM